MIKCKDLASKDIVRAMMIFEQNLQTMILCNSQDKQEVVDDGHGRLYTP